MKPQIWGISQHFGQKCGVRNRVQHSFELYTFVLNAVKYKQINKFSQKNHSGTISAMLGTMKEFPCNINRFKTNLNIAKSDLRKKEQQKNKNINELNFVGSRSQRDKK